MNGQRKVIDKLIIEGQEVCDRDKIKKALISHFRLLYEKQQSSTFDISAIGLPKLTQADSNFLKEPVTSHEIQEALLSCDPSKSPGYDGFNL